MIIQNDLTAKIWLYFVPAALLNISILNLVFAMCILKHQTILRKMVWSRGALASWQSVSLLHFLFTIHASWVLFGRIPELTILWNKWDPQIASQIANNGSSLKNNVVNNTATPMMTFTVTQETAESENKNPVQISMPSSTARPVQDVEYALILWTKAARLFLIHFFLLLLFILGLGKFLRYHASIGTEGDIWGVAIMKLVQSHFAQLIRSGPLCNALRREYSAQMNQELENEPRISSRLDACMGGVRHCCATIGRFCCIVDKGSVRQVFAFQHRHARRAAAREQIDGGGGMSAERESGPHPLMATGVLHRGNSPAAACGSVSQYQQLQESSTSKQPLDMSDIDFKEKKNEKEDEKKKNNKTSEK